MSLEDSYYDDVLVEESDWVLTQSLLIIMLLNLVMVVVQIYLTFSILTGCSSIYGLTISGKVFEAYSFTCNNPDIPPIYP